MSSLTLEWQYSPYTLALFIAALLNLSLSLIAWNRRATTGAPAFAILVFAGAEWSLAYALQLGGRDLATQLFFGNLEYIGIVTVPVAMLVFALSYTGRVRWLKPLVLGLLAVEPLLTIILLWTMPTSGPVRSSATFDQSGVFPALMITHGPWFWVNVAYSYGALLVAAAILVEAALRAPQTYRLQSGALLVAVITPLAGNAIYLAQLGPIPNLDLTPYAFTIAGLALGWALFRGRLLDLVLGFPLVAGAVIVERLPDGVVLVDGQGTIVEINPVASHIFTQPSSPKGHPVREILPEWDVWAPSAHVGTSLQTDLERGDGPTRRRYEVLVSGESPAAGRGLGWIVVLRDVTERRRAEEQLRVAEEAAMSRRIEEARLEGVLLTVRETAQQLNDVLAEASGFAELALLQPDESGRTHELLRSATEGLDAAINYVRNLQRVSRVATKATPVGLSLDLDRSVDADNAGIPRRHSE